MRLVPSPNAETPTFSVIVPAHDAAATLPRTIASVLAQTCSAFELILVDDGSRDDTLRIMLAHAAQEPRIKVISHDNRGVAASRNVGAECARGQFLAFLDADDAWHAGKLAFHARLHSHLDCDASYARIAFWDPARPDAMPAQTESRVPPGLLDVAGLIADNPVCTASNLVVSAAAFARIGGFINGMDHAEDQEWLVRAAASGATIQGIDRCLVQYRMSECGLSADLPRMLASWRRMAAPYADRIDIVAAEAVYCRYLARRALRTGAPARQALRFLVPGLRNPSSFFADRRRGLGTLAGTLAAFLIPAPLRARVFA